MEFDSIHIHNMCEAKASVAFLYWTHIVSFTCRLLIYFCYSLDSVLPYLLSTGYFQPEQRATISTLEPGAPVLSLENTDWSFPPFPIF